MALAKSSFPVPVSPVMRTLDVAAGGLGQKIQTGLDLFGESPMMPFLFKTTGGFPVFFPPDIRGRGEWGA